MHSTKFRTFVMLTLATVAVLTVSQVCGLTVLQMGLEEMCDRADKIVKAKIVDFDLGTITVGGAEFPTTTYILDVSEVFKGDMPASKDGVTLLEVTQLGSPKPQPSNGGAIQHLSTLPQLPSLKTGHEYVLMTTQPSSVGLSTTVGLGQGCFSLIDDGKSTKAANQFNNRGLFEGPVDYTVLANEIKKALAR